MQQVNKVLHQVWIQGESELPEAYRQNRQRWAKELPGWKMILWDGEMAKSQWPDFAEVDDLCYHHATRCDLILARAQRDFGGLAMGTDVTPANTLNLLQWLECNETLVVVNVAGKSASNGISYFQKPNHPFITCVCRHQLRDRQLLSSPNVWRSTGPGCWYQVLNAHPWNLSLCTDARAYTRYYSTGPTGCDIAFVDPGYAGSWHKKN